MANFVAGIILLCAVSLPTYKAETHTVVYNEEQLTGSCTKTCAELPDRTDKFGCERISNCKYNHQGWTKGFVKCNWCACDCKTSDALPEREVISSKKVITDESELFNTCETKCEANGLQRTDRIGCSEVRNCKYHAKGWLRGFVWCNYCECDCITLGYPDNYRIENVVYNLNEMNIARADQITVGSVTVENHSNSTQETDYAISIEYTDSNTWESSVGIMVGSTVKITFDELIIEEEVTVGGEVSYEYTWGETRSTTISDTLTCKPVQPPHTMKLVTVQGAKFNMDVPYTADLVTIYDDGTESTKQIEGVFKDASVTDFHVVYGEDEPV